MKHTEADVIALAKECDISFEEGKFSGFFSGRVISLMEFAARLSAPDAPDQPEYDVEAAINRIVKVNIKGDVIDALNALRTELNAALSAQPATNADLLRFNLDPKTHGLQIDADGPLVLWSDVVKQTTYAQPAALPAPDFTPGSSNELTAIHAVVMGVGDDWPDDETDPYTLRHVKWIARELNALVLQDRKVEVFRQSLLTAWRTGVDDLDTLCMHSVREFFGVKGLSELETLPAGRPQQKQSADAVESAQPAALPAPPRTPLEQFDLDHSADYNKGREDGRLYGYKVGYRHATEHLSQPAEQGDAKDANLELPVISTEDRQFLHDNPNTNDLVEWVQDYARTAILASKGTQP